MDTDTFADILTESHTWLAKAKSCCLAHTLICKAIQTGKCWDEIKGILRLKLCNVNIYTYTSWFVEIQQKDNETLAAYIHHFKTAAKWCAFDNDTVAICIFSKGLRNAPTIAAKICEKDSQTLAEVSRLVEKLSAAHKLTATFTPSTWNMMSSEDKCFVCGHTGHFGCHCPDAQCYGCDEFGHFAQDCPHKIPPLGMPHHHSRSHSRHQYTHNQRDRSHSHYSPRHRRHFSRLQSHPHSHHDRSSSFRRHTSCSSSSHHSSSHHPSADGCSHHPSCHATNRHSCTPSHTHYISFRHCSYHSMDWSQSLSSNSHFTAQGSQPRKIKQWPWPSTHHKPHCSKTVTIQDSPPDSSSDSNSYSDPLNY